MNANPAIVHFRVANNRYGSGTFISEGGDSVDFVWPVNDSMRTLYFYGCNSRGYLPNFWTSFKKLHYFHIGYNSIWMRARFGQAKQVYRIYNTHRTTGTSYDCNGVMMTGKLSVGSLVKLKTKLASLGPGGDGFC